MEYLITRLAKLYKKYGIFGTIKRGIVKSYIMIKVKLSNLIFSKKYKKEIDKIISKKEYKYIVILHPFLDYYTPVFQRPQQLATAFGKRDDTLFFYISPNNYFDKVTGIKKINKNSYLTNQYSYLKSLNLKNRVMLFSSTDLRSTIKDIKDAENRKDKIVYEYLDEINADICGHITSDFMEKHNYVINNKGIYLVTTATKLYNEIKEIRNENLALITNGVNLEDFKVNKSMEEIKKIVNLDIDYNKKIIGYYGAIACWFDYELVKKLAENKDYVILLIGINYDRSLNVSGINKYDNIKYIGSVEYKLLKYYSSICDILTIPFLVNDVTESTSPVKVFEYMAMKKPVISTNLPECTKYKSVYISKSHDEFIKDVYDILNMSNEEKIKYQKLLYKEALENTWESKVYDILKLIGGEN